MRSTAQRLSLIHILTELAHHGPENIVICTLTIVGALAVMFAMQWQLALVITLALPLCAWFTICLLYTSRCV